MVEELEKIDIEELKEKEKRLDEVIADLEEITNIKSSDYKEPGWIRAIAHLEVKQELAQSILKIAKGGE